MAATPTIGPWKEAEPAPFEAVLPAADPVAVPVAFPDAAVPPVMLDCAAASKVAPSVGSATSPLTSQAPDVYAGQAGAELDGL